VAEVEEERLDHVLRHRSMGDVDEVAGLDRQRGVDVDQRAFDGCCDHGSRSRHRCTLTLLAQQGRQSGKHRADLRRGRRATRDLEALDVPRLHSLGVGLDPGLGLGFEFGRGGEFVDEAERLGVGGLELRRRQDGLLQCGLDAEHAHRAGDASAAGQQAEGDLGEAEAGARVVVGGDPVVSGQGEFESAAQCRTAEGGDNWLAEGLEATQHLLEVFDGREFLFGIGRISRTQLVEVSAGEEGLLRRGQHDTGDVIDIGFEPLHGRLEGGCEVVVHGVDLGTGLVDDDGDDAIGIGVALVVGSCGFSVRHVRPFR
jgi:hypothetical protein